MARGTAYRFQRYGRGLNTADNLFNLADGLGDKSGRGAEARDLLNVVSRSRGNVGKRDGSTSFKARADIKDFNVVDDDTASLAIYSTTGGALFALDEGATETSLVASGLSSTAAWKFLHLPTNGGQGPYYGINGTDAPRYVTAVPAVGTWTASAGTIFNGLTPTMMVYAGNRLWVADGTSVAWSAIGNPRDWPADNLTEFSPGDGNDITALAALGNYVLVFKERDIWRIYDLDTSANVKVTDNAGTLSPRGVVSTDAGCFFLDPARGVLVTDGSSIREVSTQILPTLSRISVGDLREVVAEYWQNHLYLGVRLDGGTRRLLDYDIELDSWWLHSHDARGLGAWDQGNGRHLYAAVTGNVARLFVPGEPLDLDVIFPSFWSGPFSDFGSGLQKRVTELRLDGSGVVNVHVLADYAAGKGELQGSLPLTGAMEDGTFGGDGNFAVGGVFAGGLTIGQDSVYSIGVGRMFSVTVGNDTASPWELDAHTMFITARKD